MRAAAASALVLSLALAACGQPDFRLRGRTEPVQKSFPELRATFGLGNDVPACALTNVDDGDWMLVESVDEGIRLRLPRGWELKSIGQDFRGDRIGRYAGPGWRRITISRETNGSVGRHYSLSPDQRSAAKGTMCQVDRGSAGSFWTVYEPGTAFTARDPRGNSDYIAVGDIITSLGVRYTAWIHAAAAATRDTLMTAVANTANPDTAATK